MYIIRLQKKTPRVAQNTQMVSIFGSPGKLKKGSSVFFPKRESKWSLILSCVIGRQTVRQASRTWVTVKCVVKIL